MKVIVIGGGEVGFYLAERLSKESKDVVLIDNNAQRVQLARQEMDIQAIQGEGSSPLVLKQAGIKDAKLVVAVTTSDEVNMVACLIAQAQSKVPVQVARIRNLEYINDTDILSSEHLGIDCHINPEMEAAERILDHCHVPQAQAVIKLADGMFRLFSVVLPEDNELVGHRLMDLPQFSPSNKALICSIQRKGETLIPKGDTVIKAGDVLWLVSTRENVQEVLANVGLSSTPVKRAMLFGGGITTRFVAKKLLDEKIGVKIIDTDRERCETLAHTLDDVLVLHVNNITAEMLVEENITDYSVFIATGKNEEDNILASLLAKRLGVQKAITLIERQTYQSIIHAMGVDNVINRRIAAADKILQYIRKGKVQSTSSIGDTGAEAIEFEALQTSDAVGKPLYQVKFPKGSLVVGILRNKEAIIPRGQDIIQPGDRVVIISLNSVIPKVEKIFQVKVNYFM